VISIAIATLISTFGLRYLFGRHQKTAANNFCVGVILPLTGNSAYIGQSVKNGMDIASADYAKQEASKQLHLQLEYSDTGGDAAKVVTAYQSLVNIKNCPSIIAVQEGVKALIPLAEQDKRVLLATSVPDNGITGKNPWVFRFFVSAESDAGTMAEYAFSKLNLRKGAIIYVNNSTGISYRDSFTQKFTKLGGNIIEAQAFNPDDVDFRTQALKIKQAAPDAVYIVGYGKSIANIPIQLREAGVTATFLSIGTISQPEILQAAGEAANGLYYTTAEFATDLNAGTPELKQFVDSYKTRFGTNPVFFEFFGYDSLKLLLLAAKRGGTQPEKLREGMSAIANIPLAVGNVSVGQDGNVQFPIVVRKIVDGKWTAP
jgi:branched-chain amino acid transport system substrate-binding protein